MRPGIVQKEQQELQLRQQQQQESNAAWPHCCSARSGAEGEEECGLHLVVSLCCTALLLPHRLSFSQANGDLLGFPAATILPGVFRLLFI